ncbi:Myosin 10A, isoform D [Coelomomyces lativittatus]|nr:Myosin 10A, isoform D [Coelomomyces lativittatus]KAJ1512412.1 Myosin 10A, isoform D [Coelomomyces lativittatus]KAJ1515608.1 Myosin 10A, isoform D [Coelomomyces lativittatus]
MYTQYCMNYSDAIHLLKKLSGSKSSFMKWITQTQKQPECKGLDLASFLLKPVQRLCKYPLLLKEILKFTPAFHSDETDLVNALNTLNGVVQKVNEGGKFREEQIKLLELHSKLIWNTHTNGGLPRNPQRRVVSTVNVRKLNKQPRLLILLSDAVLVCKSEWLGSKYLVRHVWLPPIKIIVHGTSGILIEENQVFVFDTLESRDAWLNEWKREENSMELEMDDAWDPLESKNLKDPLSIVDQHSNQMLHHSTALNTAEAELIEEYIKKKVEQID